MLRIVRTGRRLGMVLNRDDRQRLVPHAFDALVVEIEVCHFNFGWQAIRLNGKAMIVRSNLDVPVARISDRLVTAAMTKHKLERLTAKRAPQQLMAKTNAKGRHS